MDLMYPLGTGSTWQDNELKYSLRSMEQNLPELGKVFVVGHRPSWLIDNCSFLEHITFPDIYTKNKDANLLDKILHVCEYTDISEIFLRASDDQVLMRPPTDNELCVRYAYDIAEQPYSWWTKNMKANKWYRRLRRTYGFLLQREKTTLHCDCHLPQPLRKSEVMRFLPNIDYGRSIGFCTNTLLLNLMKDSIGITFRKMKRKKLSVERPYEDIQNLRNEAEGKLWIGYNDKGLNDVLEQFLFECFPSASKFEK